MLKKIFSIRDGKGEIYHQPFYAHTHGEAERHFKTLTNDEKSQVNQYPEDFDLWYLGQFDDCTGKIEPLETPTHMVKAINMLTRPSVTPCGNN